MNKNTLISTLICTVFLLSGAICVFGQKSSLDCKDKKITIKMERVPLGKIFRELMVKYDIAIGFEESIFDRGHDDYDFLTTLPNKREKENSETISNNLHVSVSVERDFNVKQNWLTINVKDSTLEDVLDNIVGQMKNYKWEINDGVVNIFPLQGRDNRYENLLKLNISNYHLRENTPLWINRSKILTLTEVKDFLILNNIFSTQFHSDVGNKLTKLPVELNFSNLTLRDLFNKITKVKRGGWILKQNKLVKRTEEKEYIEIII